MLVINGNQLSLHEDVRPFFDDPVLVGTCATQPADIDAPVMAVSKSACAERRTPVAERHPKWKGSRSLEAMTERRIDDRVVPGSAAGVHDGAGVGEQPPREVTVAEVLSDLLDGVQLGRE